MYIDRVSSLESRVKSLKRLIGVVRQGNGMMGVVAEGIERLYKENGFVDPRRIDFYNIDFFRSRQGNIDLGAAAGAERHTYLSCGDHLVLVRRCAAAETDSAALDMLSLGSSGLVWCDVHFVPDNRRYVSEARAVPEGLYDWQDRRKSAAPVMLMLQVMQDSLRTREENVEIAMRYVGGIR